MRKFFLALFVLFLLQSASAFAETLTYYTARGIKNGQPVETDRHKSNIAACRALASLVGMTYESTGPGTLSGQCYGGGPGGRWNTGTWYRKTEQCTTGIDAENLQCYAAPNGEICGSTPGGGEKIKDAQGNCVQPELADKPSYCKYLSGSTRLRRIVVQYDEDGNSLPPNVTSSDGCSASVLNYNHCKQPAPPRGSYFPDGFCRVPINFSGDVSDETANHGSFSGSNGDPNGLCKPGDSCDIPDFPNITEQQPCSYVTDAEGRKSCSSFNYNGKPGNGMGCGTFNGKFDCYGTASSEGSQIDTKVTQTPTPDGGIKEEKTDVYTKVVCSGPGSCSSTTTTNKSTTIKNGNGETVSKSSECTGPLCPPGGQGGKGDADGDGFDDCATGKDCSEGTTAGIPGAPELEDVAGVGDSTGDYFGRISNAPIVSAIANFAVPTGGSCPIYSAQTMIGTFDSSAFCNLAPELLSGLRFLFLALWAWAAVRLFMTA